MKKHARDSKKAIAAGVLLCVYFAWALTGVGLAAETPPTLYSFSLPKPDGGVVPLSEYKGKVVIIVNLARNSSFADQLSGLETLATKYKDQGLVVLGIPSNDFGAEEPGDDAVVQKFYEAQRVTFPVMAKSAVRGNQELPLYVFLTKGAQKPKESAGKDGDTDQVHWNYTKFILTREGKVAARFGPDASPETPEFEIAVQKALTSKPTEPASPQRPPVQDEAGRNDDDR